MSILGFSYTTQYSPLIPHLKFLLHVCLFHWNTSLEMIGKYGYHREVEIGRIVQTRIL